MASAAIHIRTVDRCELLIAHRNDDLLAALLPFLRSHGYACVAVGAVDGALEYLANAVRLPAAVVLDDDATGPGGVARLRDASNGVPVLVLAWHPHATAGADAVLFKPFTARELVSTLARLVGRAAPVQGGASRA